MASSKSGLISARCDTRGRVARGSSSGTWPIPRGIADPAPAIFGHTSYASSGTAPFGSLVLTIQSAVEEIYSNYRTMPWTMHIARLKHRNLGQSDFTCIRIVPMHGFMKK